MCFVQTVQRYLRVAIHQIGWPDLYVLALWETDRYYRQTHGIYLLYLYNMLNIYIGMNE